MDQLRQDGRAFNEFRKPIIKYGIVPETISLQYQVNNNLLIVQLKPFKRLHLDVTYAECANVFHFQIKQAMQIIQTTFSRILKDTCIMFEIQVFAADRTIQAHIYNACLVLLIIAGFQLESIPVAMSCQIANEMIILDDERMNCLMIGDKNKNYYLQANNVHPALLEEAIKLMSGGGEQFLAYIKQQLNI